MTAATVAGVLLIALPLAFNAAFALLAARFDYPDVLRRPTGEVLARFAAGGTPLVLLWWAFALTAVLTLGFDHRKVLGGETPRRSPSRLGREPSGRCETQSR